MLLLSTASLALATVPPSDWNHANVQSGADALVAGDFDGDGYDDLIVHSVTGIDLYEGSANGLPAPVSRDLTSGLQQYWSGYPEVPLTLDVDGDGYDDLLLSRSQEFTLVYGGPAGLVTTWVHQVVLPSPVYQVATGDLNGDGYDDIVFSLDNAAGGRIVYWWPGSAMGLVQFPAFSWSGGQVFGTADLAVFDANGDGYDDVAIGGGGYATREVKVYRGGPVAPSSQAFATLQTTQAYRYLGEHLAAVGDLDGDGYEDLVSTVSDAYNGVYGFAVMRGGSAGMSAPVVTPGVDTQDPLIHWIGDTDGDGDDELLVGIPYYDSPAPNPVSNRGVVAVLKLQANNRFTQPSVGDYAMGNTNDNQFGSAIAAGDFDGTGQPDFVGTSPYPGGAASRIDAFYDVP
ncbi:MAG: VCBS repeat-containing protein [Alphaproteobacteria bacterium]|nr:VCBS repeat-containing protein [Alphaproteobacteria bacterium]